MERTNQGGSVLSFVIIGVVLAGLLVGGIYLVNRQLTQPVAPTAQKPAEKPKPAPGQNTPPAESGADKPAAPSSSAPQSNPATPNNGNLQLPATGSQETIGTLLVVGLLAGITAGYVQSRRLRLSL